MKNVIMLIATLSSIPAFAANWESTAHLGFAVEDHSSTGFEEVSGSMSFLDLAYRLPHGLQVGLRTLMQGGRRHDSAYYRLGAGPMIGYAISENWLAHGSLTYFKEAGESSDGERHYLSQGGNVLVGWERRFELTKACEVAWGAFVSAHRGTLDLEESASVTQLSRYKGVDANRGLSHGIEVAFRMGL